jgi:hypothetical protein
MSAFTPPLSAAPATSEQPLAATERRAEDPARMVEPTIIRYRSLSRKFLSFIVFPGMLAGSMASYFWLVRRGIWPPTAIFAVSVVGVILLTVLEIVHPHTRYWIRNQRQFCRRPSGKKKPPAARVTTGEGREAPHARREQVREYTGREASIASSAIRRVTRSRDGNA